MIKPLRFNTQEINNESLYLGVVARKVDELIHALNALEQKTTSQWKDTKLEPKKQTLEEKVLQMLNETDTHTKNLNLHRDIVSLARQHFLERLPEDIPKCSCYHCKETFEKTISEVKKAISEA